MNELSKLEIDEISKLLSDEWGCDREHAREMILSHEVRIIRHYVSDGPGWIGDMYIFVWGEPQFMTSLGYGYDTGWQIFFDGECKYRM